MDLALKLRRVRVILFDVDGVLTDGRIILGPGGLEFKFFDARDGHRTRLARRGGLQVFFITGRTSEAVDRRAAELGIDGVYQAVTDKVTVIQEIRRLTGAGPEEMAYMGDDLVDLPVMRRVGLAACPRDAAPEVLEQADVVIDLRGGRGAAGKFIEDILKAQGKWQDVTARYCTDHVPH